MIDLLQAFTQRRIVEAHGRHWMIVYAVQSIEGEIKEGKHLYLAVPCTEAGAAELPCAVTAIMVHEPPSPKPPSDPRPCKRCGHPEDNERHRPTFGYHQYEPPAEAEP